MGTSGHRADIFLVEMGYASSRAEAQAAIHAGKVSINGKPVQKPSQTIKPDATVNYERAHPYVSRGALKLIAALDKFEFSPQGRVCIDIGASTGGFTEVLLERGAAKVFAIDVGHGQLREKLATDPRVVKLEGVNARDLTSEHIPEPVNAIVADVSFIGLKIALAPALHFAAAGCILAALIKPQFEVGRENIGKNGIVDDDEAKQAAVHDIATWMAQQPGWVVVGTMESPIKGGGGNVEYLIAAVKS
jgi:23S rRNA (cytidine1920-2'-O)/16S rRNA (cytidine1409-2'-O)-methyltransferase